MSERPGGGGWVIRALHWAYVAFVVLAPLSNNRAALVLHALTTPVVWAHWILNDDRCALTLLEKAVRGVDDDASFFHALVSPVFRVADGDVRAACWGASVALWLVTVHKLTWADLVAELRWW